MQEYIKTLLVNTLLVFVCVNIIIALTPKWVRTTLRLLFRTVKGTIRFTYIQASRLFKFSYKNLKTFYKKKRTTKAKPQLKKAVGQSNVIPFPKRK